MELFATLLCIMLFGDRLQGQRGTVGLSGVTDNLGNTFVLSKMMTSKFPMVVILTEVAAQLRARDLELGLHWAPREQNEEAYALTNEEFGGFSPARRIAVDLGAIRWIVLPDMLKAAEDIYHEVSALKGVRVEGPAVRKTRPQDKLRVRDPW